MPHSFHVLLLSGISPWVMVKGRAWGETSVCALSDEAARQYEGPVHHYRPQQESPSPQQQPPPSSQADTVGHVPRTHRLITLADHICVSSSLFLLINFSFFDHVEGTFHT